MSFGSQCLLRYDTGARVTSQSKRVTSSHLAALARVPNKLSRCENDELAEVKQEAGPVSKGPSLRIFKLRCCMHACDVHFACSGKLSRS